MSARPHSPPWCQFIFLLAVLLSVVACRGGADLGDWQGLQEVSDEWGLIPEEANGVCVGDFDGDGAPDVFLTRVGPDRLYLNDGQGHFQEVGEDRGIAGDDDSQGCGYADYDEDGDLDLAITVRHAPSRLLRNEGDGTFVDVTAETPIAETYNQRSVLWEDVDRDGAIDLLLIATQDVMARLYAGDGQGGFEDVTPDGPPGAFRRTWGGAFFDYDNDGLPDLHLPTDFLPDTDCLLHNEGDFQFVDMTAPASISNTSHGMGSAVADVDEDGLLDLYVTNWGVNTLWRNAGDGTFYDAGQSWGVAGGAGTSGWGTFWVDIDNDSDEDLFVANGASIMAEESGTLVRPLVERNYLFLKDGPDEDGGAPVGEPSFAEAGPDAGADDAESAFGAAWGDLDQDGWVDLVVANRLGSPSKIFRNLGRSSEGSPALRLRLRGTATNRDGFGARVSIEACGRRQIRLLSSGPSLLSHGEAVLHFGLGSCREQVSVRVEWPGGEPEAFTVAPSAIGQPPLVLVEGEGD